MQYQLQRYAIVDEQQHVYFAKHGLDVDNLQSNKLCPTLVHTKPKPTDIHTIALPRPPDHLIDSEHNKSVP